MADTRVRPARAVAAPRGKVITVRSRSPFRWALRALVIAYLFLLVIWPVALVAKATFSRGLAPVLDALRQPGAVYPLHRQRAASVLHRHRRRGRFLQPCHQPFVRRCRAADRGRIEGGARRALRRPQEAQVMPSTSIGARR